MARRGLDMDGSVDAKRVSGVFQQERKEAMNAGKWLSGLGALALTVFAAGCGAGNATMQTPPPPQSATIFISGTDAPLPSVISFKVTIMGISVSEAGGMPVTVTNGPQDVDFAKLNGLHTLIDLNTIPAGTYDSVTVTLANPEIDYLNVANPQTNPPTRPTISAYTATTTPPATLTTSSVTVNLSNPLVVNAGDVIGLGFEFDIRQSLQVGTNGQLTGAVNPTLDFKAITPSDADAYIDEFTAGVTTINAGGNSFTIQGPHGRAFTVDVNQQTEWEGNETINDLTTSSIVLISGTLDRTAGTFDADTVAILSQNQFYAGGLITFVDPPTGTAQDFDLYVRSVLPANTGFHSGQISTIDLTGNEKYFIYWMHNRFVNPRWSNIFFNSALMVPGQRVTIGGPFTNGTVTVKRVVLRHEGHVGTLVANSVNVGASTFQYNSNGLAGVLFNGPVTVYVTPFTRFGGGLTSLQDLTSNPTNPLRVVGIVLKDPISSQPVFVARSVVEVTK
ncbi:MAG TPA: DUF4382 domain-containing protein [Candidatus Acidoferrum sp.]|nr:DUF4382 domain-containing protein [Candidatus Acidoferrum sp.]